VIVSSKQLKEKTVPESYREMLIALGGKPGDPKEEEKILRDVEENVLPKIAQTEEEARAAVRNLRIKQGCHLS
jgi:hypothetical protein